MTGLKALLDLILVTIWLLALSVLFAGAGVCQYLLRVIFDAWARVARVCRSMMDASK